SDRPAAPIAASSHGTRRSVTTEPRSAFRSCMTTSAIAAAATAPRTARHTEPVMRARPGAAAMVATRPWSPPRADQIQFPMIPASRAESGTFRRDHREKLLAVPPYGASRDGTGGDLRLGWHADALAHRRPS